MEKLMKLLSEIRSDVNFNEENNLIGDSILDSFDIIQIITSIDDEFDIKIPPADIVPENFNSMEAIWEMMQRLQ